MTHLDDDDFSLQLDRYRTEILVHCYRMTGSYSDAEELAQDTFARAWENRIGFEGRSSLRTWLYRIATNACLDWLEHSARKTRTVGLASAEHMTWLEPISDAVLDAVDNDDPESQLLMQESIRLSFLVLLQTLPPRQRAVFIARDVVKLSAKEVATLLDTTPEAVNSLVQRARAALQTIDCEAEPRSTKASEVAILRHYVDAHQRGDVTAMCALLASEVSITMPPEPAVRGLSEAESAFKTFLDPAVTGSWRLVEIAGNRQVGTANYLQRPHTNAYEATSIDILRIEDNRIVEVNCFLGTRSFTNFGLPLILPSTHHTRSGHEPQS